MRENPEQKYIRMTAAERPYWARGLALAGIDEAGRGPLAGPVFAGCVSLAEDVKILGVDDSKKLSPARREALCVEILARARFAQTGRAEHTEIDQINILRATRLAMERAAAGCPVNLYLVDCVQDLNLPGEILSQNRFDANSYLVAAASILAKVARDRAMDELDAIYPQYGFSQNKGYGTPAHIAALRKYGPCPAHRRSFIAKILGAPQ